MMERTIKTKDQLEIDKTVCVYEQAIYVKDMETQLKEPKSCPHFLMMGTFHVLLMSLRIAGLKMVR